MEFKINLDCLRADSDRYCSIKLWNAEDFRKWEKLIGRLKGRFWGVQAAKEVWNTFCSQFICDTQNWDQCRVKKGCFLAAALLWTSCMPERLNSLSKGSCSGWGETISKHERRFYFGDITELNETPGQISFPKCVKKVIWSKSKTQTFCVQELWMKACKVFLKFNISNRKEEDSLLPFSFTFCSRFIHNYKFWCTNGERRFRNLESPGLSSHLFFGLSCMISTAWTRKLQFAETAHATVSTCR